MTVKGVQLSTNNVEGSEDYIEGYLESQDNLLELRAEYRLNGKISRRSESERGQHEE